MGTGPLRIDVPDVIYSNTEAQSDGGFLIISVPRYLCVNIPQEIPGRARDEGIRETMLYRPKGLTLNSKPINTWAYAPRLSSSP